jgi:membrane-associated protein
VNDALSWILALIQSVDPLLRSALAGTGMFLETSVLVGLVVPGDTIVIVASTAIAGLSEYLVLLALVIVGSLGGESLGFALGRYFGPKIQASRVGQRLGA